MMTITDRIPRLIPLLGSSSASSYSISVRKKSGRLSQVILDASEFGGCKATMVAAVSWKTGGPYLEQDLVER